MPEEKALWSAARRPSSGLGVARRSLTKLNAYLDKEQLPWPNWLDDSGGSATSGGSTASRSLYVLDGKGVVRPRACRGLNFKGNQLEETILEVLKEVE